MKKLRNSIVLVALLATSSAMAYGNSGDGCKMQKQNSSCGQQHKKGNKAKKGDVVHFIMRTVHNMDLTKDQKSKLLEIQKKFKKSKFVGISENGFDKKAYIAAKSKTREDRVKEEANFIDSVYSILDKKQITYIGMKIQSMEKHRNQMQNRKFNNK